MQVAKIVDNEIVEVETINRLPRLSLGRWWDLRDNTVLEEWLEETGYKEVVQARRPLDTPTSTFDLRIELSDGVPVQQWIEREFAPQELELREQLAQEQQKSEASAAIAEAYIHLNQQAHEDGQNWVQPTGVHDAYTNGITVKHDGKTWESIVFANVWAPGVSGWREVVSEGGIAAWVQPTGSHDAYNKEDRVSFNGSNYESLIDGNVWSPSEYPAAWKIV